MIATTQPPVPRITVLMPVYNGLPYIREAVESVISQDCEDWELIISDNGSADGTRDYLRSLTDSRIRVHIQTTNLGIFGNLNFLLAQSRSAVAKILCADDKLLPRALGRIANFMEDRPDCAISRCWAAGQKAQFSPGGRAELEGALPSRLEPAATTLAFATFGNLVGNLSKAACRPQRVLEAGGFNQLYPYAGDYEGWARVAVRHGLEFQNEELVFERIHQFQNSNLLNKRNELFPQINALLRYFSSLIDDRDIKLLKLHWTLHFLSQRTPRFVKQLMRGEIRLAFSIWSQLPLAISPVACIAAYPLVRFNFGIANSTTRRLFNRIVEINKAARR